MSQTNIERNEQFNHALAMMQGTAPFVFITGRAGTGKSTLLKYFRDTTYTKCVYLAPTGVAALNIEGQTLHSFFHFTPGITPDGARKKAKSADQTLYQALGAILIDEISMVRADLMDCVDVFLRAVLRSSLPFGGKRIIAIGDLYQLPPVVTRDEQDAFASRYATPYFFSSDVMQGLYRDQQIAFLELEKIYRQQENDFIALLQGIRNRSITDKDLAQINSRITHRPRDISSTTIRLTTTNAASDDINNRELEKIEARGRTYTGERTGDFPDKDLPTDETLLLKLGSRVMCLVNDPLSRYVNGTLGTIKKLDHDVVTVRLDESGECVDVRSFTWTLYRSTYNIDAQRLDQEKIGSFTQIPIRLAWATTIHKSQGKTFDRCVIDLGRRAFAAGQIYVALSRCRTFEGITLTAPVTRSQLILDDRIISFIASLQGQTEIKPIGEQLTVLGVAQNA